MYPTSLCDIIEINQLAEGAMPVRFSQSGISVGEDPEKNLCMKAWKRFSDDREIPPVAIHLHKQIPVGAGLGGGSSNATSVLKGLNLLASDPASPERLTEMAQQLGSDCPFFLHEIPMMMEGRGEVLSQVNVSMKKAYLVLLFPEIHISTAEAYAAVSPSIPEFHLRELIKEPIRKWKLLIINDFEKCAFLKHPGLELIKQALYTAGASYASMSGSGSSLFGIFDSPPDLPEEIQRYVIWKGPL